MKWHRTETDEGIGHTGTVETSDDGQWTITKEWYADGPSLFTWVLRSADNETYEDFPTRRAARAHAEHLAHENPIHESVGREVAGS